MIACGALIAVQMRPVLGSLARTVVGTVEGADALLQAGILAWVTRHLGSLREWTDLPIFHPARHSIVAMDSLLGQAFCVAPLAWLADPTPALLYNVACLVSLGLVALAGALLWRAGDSTGGTTRAGTAATLAALLLLGSPYTASYIGMLNQITPPWPVFMLAAAWCGWRHFGVGQPRRRWWWVAAGCLAMQAAWGWYGFASAVFVLATIGAPALWAARRRRLARQLLREVVPPLAAALAVVLLFAWPYLEYRRSHPDFTRTIEEVRFYSIDLNSFDNLGSHRLTPADVLGRGEPAAGRALRNVDAVVHPGWLALAGALVGAFRFRRLPVGQRRYGLVIAAVGLVGLVMAFGDSVGVLPGREWFRLPLPFGILQDVLVPFKAFRAPMRFAYLATVAVVWWGTAGIMSVLDSCGARSRNLVATAVMVAICVESIPMGLLAIPTAVDGRPGRYALPADLGPGAILTLPAPPTEAQEGPTEARWVLRALATGRPVTGGVSGWVPPETRRLRSLLAACEAGERSPRAVLDSLAAAGIAGAEVCTTGGEPQRAAFWRGVLDSLGGPGTATAPGYVFYALPTPEP